MFLISSVLHYTVLISVKNILTVFFHTKEKSCSASVILKARFNELGRKSCEWLIAV